MTEERREGMGGGKVAADELRLLLERAERLEEEKRGISDDIKDVMAEAKGRGFDPKAIRKLLAIRKKRKEEYQEEEAILETYMHALGDDLMTLGSNAAAKADENRKQVHALIIAYIAECGPDVPLSDLRSFVQDTAGINYASSTLARMLVNHGYVREGVRKTETCPGKATVYVPGPAL